MSIFGKLFSRSQTSAVSTAKPSDDVDSLYQRVMGWEKNQPDAGEATRAVQDFNRMARAYAAAMFDEYNSDLPGTYGSANTEIFPYNYSARTRTRTLAKDTPQGKAVVRTFQNYVVGERWFELEMQYGEYDDDNNFTEDKKINRVIEKHWRRFMRRENFTISKQMSGFEAGRVVEASLVREGNIICRLYRNFPNNPYGFAVDFLEQDRLQEQFQGKSVDGNPIRASIEYDKTYKNPIYYHILQRHPAEFFNVAAPQSPGVAWRERVPYKDVILFSNLRDRAEQDIGMTELDAAVQTIWRNQQFVKALTLVAIASHMRALVLEKDEPNGLNIPEEHREAFYNSLANLQGGVGIGFGGTGDPGGDPVQDQQRSGQPTQIWKPGMERQLPPGWKAKVIGSEFPTEASGEFRQKNGEDVALATGISTQHATANYQNLGFMAALMCQEPHQRNCRIRQKNHVDGRLDRIFREWLSSSITRGVFDEEGVEILMSKLDDYVDAAHFKGQGFPFINPLVQAQALILLNEAGHITRQEVQNQLPSGMSFEKILRILKKEKDELEQNGLNLFDVDATRPTMSKGEPGQVVPQPDGVQPGGDADIPPKSKVANPLNTRRLNRLGLSMENLIKMSNNGDH